MSVEIIRFTFNDKSFLEQAFEIRRIVFVVEQECPPELEYEHEEESTHYLGFRNGKPVATARWRLTDTGIKLERFAVLKEERTKGVAFEMVNRLLQDVKPLNQHTYLHAQLDAMPLYEKAGFVKIGPQFEEAGLKHFKMFLPTNLS